MGYMREKGANYEKDFARIEGLGAVIDSNTIKETAYSAAAESQFSKAEQHGFNALPLLAFSAIAEFGGFVVTCSSLQAMSAQPEIAGVGAVVGLVAMTLGSIPFFKSLKYFRAAGIPSRQGSRYLDEAQVFRGRIDQYQKEADDLYPYK